MKKFILLFLFVCSYLFTIQADNAKQHLLSGAKKSDFSCLFDMLIKLNPDDKAILEKLCNACYVQGVIDTVISVIAFNGFKAVKQLVFKAPVSCEKTCPNALSPIRLKGKALFSFFAVAGYTAAPSVRVALKI